jgi:hypothetical protein
VSDSIPQEKLPPMNKAGVKTNAGDANASGTLQPVTQATANAEADLNTEEKRPLPSVPAPVAIRVYAGNSQTFFLNAKGRFFVLGRGIAPLTQTSENFNTLTEVVFPSAGAIAKVSTSLMNPACFLFESGKVQCLAPEGNMQKYRLPSAPGVIVSHGFAEIRGVEDAIDVAAGVFHGCALLKSKKVVCWGDNTNGQLGDGTTTGNPAEAKTVVGIPNMTSIVSHTSKTCGIDESGQVWCWGRIDSGPSNPVQVAGLKAPIRQVSLGVSSACALNDKGTVQCWGSSKFGELGSAGVLVSDPVDVPGLAEVVSIGVGYMGACALQKDGKVFCWGQGGFSPPWKNTPDHQPKPVSISGNMKALSIGAFHACAVTDAFEAKCWFYDQRMSEAPLGKPSPDSRRFNTTGGGPFIGSTLPSDLP